MQNKGAIRLFTILLALACLYQISFSFFTSSFESKAEREAIFKVDSLNALSALTLEEKDSLTVYFTDKYLRDNGSQVVYPVFGYTFDEAKEKEINLGLDLKGGMSVTLEVSIPDLILNIAGNPQDKEFLEALALAKSRMVESQDDFVTNFYAAYQEVAPNSKLAGVFHSRDNKELFPRDASNDEIIEKLREEARIAIDNTEKILRTRIDKFGVTQPTIQKQQYSGRILVELPGVRDKERVRKVLQSTANLEFWETYANQDVFPLLSQANDALAEDLYPGFRTQVNERLEKANATDSTATVEEQAADSASSKVDDILGGATAENDSTGTLENAATVSEQEQKKLNPLFSLLNPNVYQDPNTGQTNLGEGAVVGYALVSDTAEINRLLARKVVTSKLPRDLALLWSSKSSATKVITLFGIAKNTANGKPKLDGSAIVDSKQDFDFKGDIEVSMQMNADGAATWAAMTKKNVGKAIAIILDDAVQSAPNVINEIPNGRSSISMGSGSRTEQLKEAEDLANILKAGALPAPASIVDESIVGPSLGEKNINAGLTSFGVAFLIVLVYMVFYYKGAGLVSNVALIANLFFLLGVLASLGASLTLPGIAGIVLTIGMSVDANVLIYERIREELRNGKGLRQAVTDGYSKAYAAIIDGNLTTLLTGFVLVAFGSGPIKGFATTLIIGIFTSLFSAIFITRLIIEARISRKLPLSFSTKFTANLFTKVNINFVGKRKLYYIISGVVILAGVISFATKGLNLGVDFTGGRTYTVKFDKIVSLETLRDDLAAEFGDAPEVKTFGAANQVKITTNYLIDETGNEIDGLVEEKLANGLNAVSDSYDIMESRKVDPTISDDIEQSAFLSIIFALLIIFLYILFRFQRWQYGLGAILAMIHDVIVVLAAYSILFGIVPFSLEIDQAFIAAILTVVGYSINDTVIVFDRIREFLSGKSGEENEVINKALNSTLSRTLNTSFTTFLVLFLIFVFGGESIRGFVFALMIGVVVGTYSSICIATPSVIDLSTKLRVKKK